MKSRKPPGTAGSSAPQAGDELVDPERPTTGNQPQKTTNNQYPTNNQQPKQQEARKQANNHDNYDNNKHFFGQPVRK